MGFAIGLAVGLFVAAGVWLEMRRRLAAESRLLRATARERDKAMADLDQAEFERDEYAKFVIICSCCHELVTPGMSYVTQYVDGDSRIKCEACCPRCSYCGEDLAEGEGTRKVIFASNDPSQDDVVAVTCAACERGVWHCGGCGAAYEADVADCTDPACDCCPGETDEERKAWLETHCKDCGDEQGPGVVVCSCE